MTIYYVSVCQNLFKYQNNDTPKICTHYEAWEIIDHIQYVDSVESVVFIAF